MRKKMTARVLSVALSAAMVMSMTACSCSAGGSGKGKKGADKYTIYTDANGKPIDLGGMEIIMRDWWTNPDDYFMTNPKNEYDEARKEYVEWAQETYNFTFKEQAISDWGSTPQDFVDYATTGGDENYVFVVRDDAAIAQAMATGLMYDLSTLDCLDFSDSKFQSNLLHEQYGFKGGIYAMYAGVSEPRDGLFINIDILKDAGVDVNEIYDAQKNGTWTWDKFTEIMDKVQVDKDNDGVNDIWGFTGNTGSFTSDAVYSNGGQFVGKDANGYVYGLDDPKTVAGLQFSADIQAKYYMPRPDGAAWDYYKEEYLNGTVAFCCDGFYAGCQGSYFAEPSFEQGFVMIPAGPKGKLVNCWSNNPVALPACYDADKAWKLAFAWNVYTDDPAGYEGYNGQLSRARLGAFDDRAVEETVPMMSEKEHGMISYGGMVPELEAGPTLIWNIYAGADVSAAIDGAAESWKSFIAAANAR